MKGANGMEITKAWTFKSSSGSAQYETLQYEDGSTSCNCMGWTRRNPPGGRNCKHTRAVDMGSADGQATACHDYRAQPARVAAQVRAEKTPVKADLKPLRARKIQW